MNTPSHHTGFTRKELVLSTVLLFLGISCYSLAQDADKPGSEALSAAKRARMIHTLLVTWAQDQDQQFPVAQHASNEAFRELFKKRLLDREDLFAIPGDAWHKNSPSGKGPDSHISSAPGFPQALMPGECAYAYVSGWDTASPSPLPIIANAFTESLGVYSNNRSHKGGVFGGTKAVYVTVGGSAYAADLSSDFRIMENKDGKAIDIFSKEWGTNPDNIKNPES